MAHEYSSEGLPHSGEESDGIFERMEHQVAMQDPVALDRLKVVLIQETEGEPEVFELLYRSYVMQMALTLDGINSLPTTEQGDETDTGEENGVEWGSFKVPTRAA